MKRPGFYHVTFAGCVGVGHCAHEHGVVTGEPYESWTVLFLSKEFAGNQHPATVVPPVRS